MRDRLEYFYAPYEKLAGKELVHSKTVKRKKSPSNQQLKKYKSSSPAKRGRKDLASSFDSANPLDYLTKEQA